MALICSHRFTDTDVNENDEMQSGEEAAIATLSTPYRYCIPLNDVSWRDVTLPITIQDGR